MIRGTPSRKSATHSTATMKSRQSVAGRSRSWKPNLSSLADFAELDLCGQYCAEFFSLDFSGIYSIIQLIN
jgi:hypothetical protein